MTIDTANIRRDAEKYIGTPFVAEALQLCGELDLARAELEEVKWQLETVKKDRAVCRADVLKLRDSLRDHDCGYSWDVLNIDPCVYCTAVGDTESYEQYR